MTTDYMREALDLARQGEGRDQPESDGRRGAGARRRSRRPRLPHLGGREARRGRWRWKRPARRARGATLYVTLEPCSHQGRTGPCTDALIAAGVARVVAADGGSQPAGRRARASAAARGRHRGRASIQRTARARRDEAQRAFVHFMRTGRPLVTLKAAVTLDGKISAPDDNQGWITSEAARAHVQQLRHASDAILTGIGTVLADDCLLTDRTGLRAQPPAAAHRARFAAAPAARRRAWWQAAEDDVLVVTTSAASPERRRALEDRGVEMLTCDGPAAAPTCAGWSSTWRGEKYLSLMIEAGSKVNWAALESDVVDKIFFYYAPKILGGLQSLPVVGGSRAARGASDAIVFRDVTLHQITRGRVRRRGLAGKGG